MIRYFLPLAVFILLTIALVVGLKLDPRRVPSPFIGKPAPSFTLSRLGTPEQFVSDKDFLGEIWLLNVWASWCAGCLEEHPLLMEFLRGKVKMVGLNYKDDDDAAQQWLTRWGDPYNFSLSDASGRVGLDWGVYGVPETFVIDEEGIVRYKHIGPLRREDVKETLLPLVRELQAAARQ